MKFINRVFMVALAVLVVLLLASCGTPLGSSPKSSVATTTPTSQPTIPVLEVGQGSQFPAFIVTLRRVVWDGNTVKTYWLFSNNGAQKVDLNLVEFAPVDNAGNEGEPLWWSAPNWDEKEKALGAESYTVTLWPGQNTVHFHAWQFGPLSQGIRVTATYTELVNNQLKTYKIMWNIRR